MCARHNEEQVIKSHLNVRANDPILLSIKSHIAISTENYEIHDLESESTHLFLAS